MLPIINRQFLSLLTLLLPLTNSVAAEQTYLLTKEQLKCLYAQVDNFLSEPADPVIILLTTQCNPSDSPPLPSGEKTELPLPNPTIGSAATATLKPEDVLVLSKKQLKCFQKQFDELIQPSKDAIQVSFSEHCSSGNTP
jgi:hypothetical protein